MSNRPLSRYALRALDHERETWDQVIEMLGVPLVDDGLVLPAGASSTAWTGDALSMVALELGSNTPMEFYWHEVAHWYLSRGKSEEGSLLVGHTEPDASALGILMQEAAGGDWFAHGVCHSWFHDKEPVEDAFTVIVEHARSCDSYLRIRLLARDLAEIDVHLDLEM